MDLTALTQQFDSLFGEGPTPKAVRAPGRVNLIGEHTDYNDGFVLPIAIEREIVALVRPRDDRHVVVRSTGATGMADIDLDTTITPGEPAWANYPAGVLAALTERGVTMVGADILFDSTIPSGGGLSSSAALEVATALAMQAVAPADWTIEPAELARLCQWAEHEFAGTPCGIMDQSIVVMGQAGRALLLDCRDGSTRQVRFDEPTLVLLVCDTQVAHELNDGGYAARRAQCEQAATTMGLKSLRDASAEQVETCEALTDIQRMRARHVVGEIARTVQAADALAAGDWRAFGRLMGESHASLRDDYQVSCEELDAVVDLATPQAGVYGARMTGGGFGGCAIVLTEADTADAVSEAIAAGFDARFGRRCPIFATRAAAGASIHP